MTHPTEFLDVAYSIARDAHEGQVDKSGQPYIEHPYEVAGLVAETCPKGLEPTYMAAAVLHDVIEDSDWTLEMLGQSGIPADVIEAVEALTHRKGETRLAYYERVKANPIALVVKRADVEHNSSEERLAALDEATQTRLRTKYAEAKEVLG